MGNVLITILTDSRMREQNAVEQALLRQAQAADPWFNDQGSKENL